jgi:hypothetical protein
MVFCFFGAGIQRRHAAASQENQMALAVSKAKNPRPSQASEIKSPNYMPVLTETLASCPVNERPAMLERCRTDPEMSQFPEWKASVENLARMTDQECGWLDYTNQGHQGYSQYS